MVISTEQGKYFVCSDSSSLRTSVWSMSLIVVFLLLMLSSISSNAATFKVSPDREEVAMNDSLTISFRTQVSVDDEPDFTPLEKDFSIINTLKRRDFSMMNGKITNNIEWLVEVMPRRDGTLIIPAISFGSDVSPESKVVVKNVPSQSGPLGQSDQTGDIFIEIEALPEQSWVQAQIIYTIRLFRAINTLNSSLSDPKISGGQMIIEKLEDSQYETYRNNKRYIVLERQYALFPQSSGELTIEPIVFTAQVHQQTRNRFAPFGQGAHTIQRLSRPINLEIKPIPTDYEGKTWLPTKKVDISEKWMKDVMKLEVGEPVTRAIIIKATGLSSEQIPEIGTAEIDGFKTYPDQAELHTQTDAEGVLGIRVEKSAIIPNAAGEYVLPAVELEWFNTLTGEMEVAQLPERIINVLPAASTNAAVVESDMEELLEQPANTSTEIIMISAGCWPWVSLVLGIVWFLTLLLWWKTKQLKTKVIEPVIKTKLSERKSLKNLRETSKLNDAEQMKKALLVWGESVWPNNAPISLSELALRCGTDVQTEVNLLNQSLYGSSEKPWDGQRLLSTLEAFDNKTVAEQGEQQSNLKPLNKI